MKKTIFLLIMIFASSIQAQNQEVQKVIETFFEGFHAKDTVKMKSVCSDKIILQSIMENAKGAKLSDESAKEFYNSIATIPSDFKFEEKILNYSIQVDGTMAHVWTPYEFYINGKLSHSGVNAFTLYKENGIWKIIYCIDTRRK
ncbi:nuclear transport factor 2 family protein [Flavobacterium chungnamense]